MILAVGFYLGACHTRKRTQTQHQRRKSQPKQKGFKGFCLSFSTNLTKNHENVQKSNNILYGTRRQKDFKHRVTEIQSLFFLNSKISIGRASPYKIELCTFVSLC